MGAETVTLTQFEVQVLQALQQQFPLVERPYRQIAESIDAAEDAVMHCVERLLRQGLIRRLGASINSRQIGYASLLAAARVAPDCIEAVASLVNSFAEVTHNYLRDGEYNMWFTVIAPDEQQLNAILAQIVTAEGVEALLRLPAKRVFKVSVKFPLTAG